MTTHLALMVPGSTEYDGVVEIHAPYDGELIGTLDAATSDTVEQALATAHVLFRDRSRWLPKAQRIEILARTVELMEAAGTVTDAAGRAGRW